MQTPATTEDESTLSHIVTSILYTIVTVIVLGLIYPLVMTGLESLSSRIRRTDRSSR